ncbi:uronate dehydrogenase [Limimaricola variabilis]|uniref:Uronate dehydrogenase n=1 Tax=Limimaricola variabilis TaxID=1492771 RepID=A0ABR6HT67_9RHOB|nr:NAD(P)-dependent oxidoreductase [Limimaricola variabilis]MBB3713564.1 uronate dehydrogenase [Limimaricola variabilis]
MKRLLITGAGGGLGRMLRARLGHMAETLRLSDIAAMEPAGPDEEVVTCDLADAEAVHELVADCDGVVHLGGVSVEREYELIEAANLRGVYNLYEAARAHGRPRIVFASSNHVVGYHPQTARLDAGCSLRPDSLYGVSKAYGEAMASLYHDKFGQETAIVRIGSCTPEPVDWRMLSTWFSHDDFVSLIEAVFRAPHLGCPVVWGASANDAGWWDNAAAGYLGWQPRDNAAAHAARIHRDVPRPGPRAAVVRFQGGAFTDEPIHGSRAQNRKDKT